MKFRDTTNLELNEFVVFKLDGRVFTKLSLVTLKKSSTWSSKFLNNFITKVFGLNTGCNTNTVV